MGTAAQEGATPTHSSSLHSASLELYLGLSSEHQDDRIHLQIWDCSTRKPHQLRARYMSLAQLTAVTAPVQLGNVISPGVGRREGKPREIWVSLFQRTLS